MKFMLKKKKIRFINLISSYKLIKSNLIVLDKNKTCLFYKKLKFHY